MAHPNAITLQGAMLIAILVWAYWVYRVQPSDKVVAWSLVPVGALLIGLIIYC